MEVGHGQLRLLCGATEGLSVRLSRQAYPTWTNRVPLGTYSKLYDLGQLEVAEGLRVQPVLQVWEAIRQRWGRPKLIVCDRFRLPELQDAIKGGVRLEPRITR